MIVSDFPYYPGQRARGPVVSLIRCDRSSISTDHHSGFRFALNPPIATCTRRIRCATSTRWPPAVDFLDDWGHFRSWGVGRPTIQGSQLLLRLLAGRDRDGFLVEHFTDGDVFDNTLEPGWARSRPLAWGMWGPQVTPDFLGVAPPSALPEEDDLGHQRAWPDEERFHNRTARPPESSQFMTVSILRTVDALVVPNPTLAQAEGRHGMQRAPVNC